MEILSNLSNILHQCQSLGLIDNNFSIKGCIHIGAHEGQEYPIYKHYGINNLIFYEPLQDNFNNLKNKVGSEVDLRNTALGNINGEIEMNLESRGLSSSILEPSYHLEQYPQIEFNNKELVKITRLDDESFDRSKFNFINIDVQGYELEVFKGAEKTLENIDLIISEINNKEMYKNCAMVHDIDEFLSNFGLERIVTYWQLDGGTWGDGLYIKVKE